MRVARKDTLEIKKFYSNSRKRGSAIQSSS